MTSLLAHAQPPPAGFAQVYAYGDRENLPPGGNYGSLIQAVDGSLITHPHTRDWFRLRNTTLVPISFGKSLAGMQTSKLYSGNSIGNWFGVPNEGMAQLKADSFFTRPGWKKPIAYFASFGNKVIGVEIKDNKQRILIYDGITWEVLNLPMEFYDYPQNILSVQTDRYGIPFVAVVNENSTEVFRYDSIQNRLEHSASYDIRIIGGSGVYQFADKGNFIYVKDGKFFKLSPGKNALSTQLPDAHIISILNGLMIFKEKR